MIPLLKKLNYKEGITLFSFDMPSEVEQLLTDPNVNIESNKRKVSKPDFVLFFVYTFDDISKAVDLLLNNLPDDPIIWMCYPKQSSKKYSCQFNRDTGWNLMGKLNVEPVRQVAINEDWSALRFRKIDQIKKLSRNFGLLSKKDSQ